MSGNVNLFDDGNGNVSISYWNITGLAQPTSDQLAAITPSDVSTFKLAQLQSQFNSVQANLNSQYPQFGLVYAMLQAICTQYLNPPMTTEQWQNLCLTVWMSWTQTQV